MTKPASLSDADNHKLGPLIHGWSLPAGREWSCPGETGICAVRCYAKRGYFHMRNVKDSHKRNFEFSQTDQFVPWMLGALQFRMVRIMRVHVSGDFYESEAYARKWLEIVQSARRTHFFAYTRSWQDQALLPELIRLSQEKNFSLWWSMDRITGPAPVVRGVRRCYMAIDDADAATAPDDCDLVFRDLKKTVMKKANGVQVCPPENGVKLHPSVGRITCSSCGICWSKDRTARWEAMLADPIFHEDADICAPA